MNSPATAPSINAPLRFSRGPEWAHRIALAPLTNQQSHADGTMGDDEHAWLVRRAEGGFAAVSTCAAHVSADGQSFPGQLGIWDDLHLTGLSRLADDLRSAGAVSTVQLQHGGRRADATLSGLPLVSAFDDARSGATALTTQGVKRVVADFAGAAHRAEQAGFDGVEVHGAHGYLLAQFLDSHSNTRSDRYGGSLEGGYRLLAEILDEIRAATGPDLQLGIRLSAERAGIDLSEAKDVAARLMAAGVVDYLDLSLWDAFKLPHDEQHRDRPLLEHFTDLPRGTTRLGVAGKIDSGAAVAACLERGADFVYVGTAGILEHDFARSVLADPLHTGTAQPVSRDHLAGQSVGPAFVDYLATTWDDFVV